MGLKHNCSERKYRVCLRLNLLKPSGFFTYHLVEHLKTLHGAHAAFMCFVWISEQTATFGVYIIDWLVFINVVESVYSAVRTDSLYTADYVQTLNG